MNLKQQLKKYRNVILILMDIAIITIAYFSIYFFNNINIFTLSAYEIHKTLKTILIFTLFFSCTANIMHLYRSMTRFESSKDYLKYTIIIIITSFIVSGTGAIFLDDIHTFRTNLLAAILISVAMIAYRIVLRFLLNKELVIVTKQNSNNRKNVLIVGGGEACKQLISNIKHTLHKEYKIVGIIDDNALKFKYSISGIPILGNRTNLLNLCKEYSVHEIFFSICNIDFQNKREILDICQKAQIKVKVLPGVNDLIKGKNLYNSLRDVQIEDLLGREVQKLDNSKISPLVTNKTILITGAGGSIGSEICRQIIDFKPTELIIIDIYENTLYEIELELKRKYPNIKIIAIIASIRDAKRMDEIFEKYRPYLVFNSAAHKHVPLMETSPMEAIKNNVFGTWNIINSADKYNVKKFIQISTDKAVNPTNIMGATKRLCEMMIQAKDKVSMTHYAAVRFGNVLGSNGSVIPVFKKQIENGGPVTLTHKDITRYFMTIPEAVSLVLQAMTYARGGEIFVLNMGKPVKIYDLAKSLIRLSGYTPEVDIKIKITGLRPGEKLFEELLMDSNILRNTENEKIFVEQLSGITIEDVENKLGKLNLLINQEVLEIDTIKETIKDIVPTYYEAKY